MTTESVDTPKATVSMGFPAALFLVFLTLKLAGIIGWSWWWVFAPFWVPLALLLVTVVILFFVTLGAKLWKDGR